MIKETEAEAPGDIDIQVSPLKWIGIQGVSTCVDQFNCFFDKLL